MLHELWRVYSAEWVEGDNISRYYPSMWPVGLGKPHEKNSASIRSTPIKIQTWYQEIKIRNITAQFYGLNPWSNHSWEIIIELLKKIPYCLQNSKVHYYVQNSSQLYLHFTVRYLFRFSNYNIICISHFSHVCHMLHHSHPPHFSHLCHMLHHSQPSHFSHVCHMLHQSHPPQFDQANIWCRIQIWNLTDIQLL